MGVFWQFCDFFKNTYFVENLRTERLILTWVFWMHRSKSVLDSRETFKAKFLRDDVQVSLLILSKLIDFIPLKLSENLWFSDNFKGDES